jgi:RNA polymerase sigma-70 factor (ECF subfamily)
VSEEDEFISRLRHREPKAYEELVRRFESRLYRYFMASHGDPQLALEQSADCFGNLVESLPKMTGGPDQLQPFVYAVARNVLRREWRQRRRADWPLSSAETIIDGRRLPEMELEAQEQSAQLIAAIRQLDPPTRDVFILRFVEQLSVAAVADIVGEPIGTVKSRLHRGRRRLAQILCPENRPT